MDKTQQAKEFLKKQGFYFQMWSIDDVMCIAKDSRIKITKKQAIEALEYLEGNETITYDSIMYYLKDNCGSK